MMVTILEMESVIHIQIMDENVCILLHANTFRKGMNTSLFFSVMSKIIGQAKFFYPWYGNQSRRKKILNSNQLYST